MCSHLHYPVRKESALGVLLYYCCTSIHSAVYLSTTHLLWDRSSTQPHALPCYVALHSSRLLTSDHGSLTQLRGQCRVISGFAYGFISEAGWSLRQIYLQLSSGFRQGFASAVSRGWPHWQQGLASKGTLPNRERFCMARTGCNSKAMIVFHVNVCFGLCLNDYLSLICVPNYDRFKLFSIILFSIRCDPED